MLLVASLCRCHDDDAAKDADGDGVPDEVDEVGAVLLMNHQLYTMAFNFYCRAAMQGDDDLDEMTLNGFCEFCKDAKIANQHSKHCKISQLDMVFREIDAMGKKDGVRRLEEEKRQQEAVRRGERSGIAAPSGTPRGAANSPRAVGTPREQPRAKREEIHNAVNALNRVEFMAALVRVAISKYLLPGDVDDLSEALQARRRLLALPSSTSLGPPSATLPCNSVPSAASVGPPLLTSPPFLANVSRPPLQILFQSCIQPSLRRVLRPPDDFRRDVAYSPEVTAVLCKHEHSLRVLFALLCQASNHASRSILPRPSTTVHDLLYPPMPLPCPSTPSHDDLP